LFREKTRTCLGTGQKIDAFGTTEAGGSTYVDFNNTGDGTIFKMTPADTLTNLASFAGANGVDPQAALVQGSDENFYGATSSGIIWSGVIFQLVLQ
jgi:hypothetical protein